MPSLERRDYNLYINIPCFIRLLPLLGSVLLMGSVTYLFTLSFWWLDALLVSGAVMCLRLAFPAQSTKARLTVRHDGISFVPRRMDQRFNGEQVVQIAIGPTSTELLLCRSMYEGYPDGYRPLVRDTDDSKQEIAVQFWKILNADECRKITAGMAAATGLPVRLALRKRSATGTVEESPWLPPQRKENIQRSLMLLASAGLPFVGGIVAGYLRPRPAVTISIGLLLWLLWVLVVVAYTRWHRASTRTSVLLSLASVFSFGAAYGVTFAAVAFVLRTN